MLRRLPDCPTGPKYTAGMKCAHATRLASWRQAGKSAEAGICGIIPKIATLPGIFRPGFPGNMRTPKRRQPAKAICGECPTLLPNHKAMSWINVLSHKKSASGA